MKITFFAVAAGLLVMPGPLSAARATVTVPVLVCPTSVGVNSVPKPVASSAKVPAPDAQLVVYSTTSAYLQVLGPKGMACQAEIGADGGATITVAPAQASGLNQGGVASTVEPACVGCMLDLACPFFLTARKAAAEYPEPCPKQPSDQKTVRLSNIAVAIYDPAGQHVPKSSAGLVPSDNQYPTNGVVVYNPYTYKGRRGATAMEVVCVLPAKQHATCTAVLDEFLATQVNKFDG